MRCSVRQEDYTQCTEVVYKHNSKCKWHLIAENITKNRIPNQEQTKWLRQYSYILATVIVGYHLWLWIKTPSLISFVFVINSIITACLVVGVLHSYLPDCKTLWVKLFCYSSLVLSFFLIIGSIYFWMSPNIFSEAITFYNLKTLPPRKLFAFSIGAAGLAFFIWSIAVMFLLNIPRWIMTLIVVIGITSALFRNLFSSIWNITFLLLLILFVTNYQTGWIKKLFK